MKDLWKNKPFYEWFETVGEDVPVVSGSLEVRSSIFRNRSSYIKKENDFERLEIFPPQEEIGLNDGNVIKFSDSYIIFWNKNLSYKRTMIDFNSIIAFLKDPHQPNTFILCGLVSVLKKKEN